MFGFLKKKAPPICPTNPGITQSGQVEYARGDKSWSETFDVLAIAESVLEAKGHAIRRRESWLELPASRFTLLPRFVELHPLDSGGIKSTTTMQVNHPTLCPAGLFEFQHATGDDIADSIRKGIVQWAEMDLVTLLEALQPNPATCTLLKMNFPPKNGHPERSRRAVLGPVTHWQERPPAENEKEDEAHCFCSCCLLTRSFETFKEFFDDSGFYGLRLYAARNPNGEPLADCRVNGNEWAKGADALREYVKTWPDAGFEVRKQYVVLQNDNGNS
jgi:uncharacterized protein DUF6348